MTHVIKIHVLVLEKVVALKRVSCGRNDSVIDAWLVQRMRAFLAPLSGTVSTPLLDVTYFAGLSSAAGQHNSSRLELHNQLLSFSLEYKKLRYRRGTARCVVSIEILPIATQQCRNYLYDKS